MDVHTVPEGRAVEGKHVWTCIQYLRGGRWRGSMCGRAYSTRGEGGGGEACVDVHTVPEGRAVEGKHAPLEITGHSEITSSTFSDECDHLGWTKQCQIYTRSRKGGC